MYFRSILTKIDHESHNVLSPGENLDPLLPISKILVSDCPADDSAAPDIILQILPKATHQVASCLQLPIDWYVI